MTKHYPEGGELCCAKCLNWKPLSDFYKSPTQASGYQSYCKVCTKAAATARYHKKALDLIYKDRE